MARRIGLILILIIIATSIPRVLGIFDDFWLDEIWSYNIASQVHHPLDVLSNPEARIDNNHPLNTLLMWMIGEHADWRIYRIPSLLAGIGSMVLTASIALRRGKFQAILATALVGFSYPLIFYSSEARGYALAVFFALLAFDAAERYLVKPRWSTAGIFAVACGLGLLSHLTFVHFYAGVFVWSVWRLRSVPLQLVRLHFLPIVFIVAIYLIFVRKMILGGSPPTPMLDALSAAIAGIVAATSSDSLNLLLAAIALAGFGWLCFVLHKQGSDLWIFLLVMVVLSPVLIIGRQMLTLPADEHQPLAPRYFLVMLPFVFLAVSFVLTNPRPIAFVILAAFFAASVYQTIEFLIIGRGHYSDAVRYMLANTPRGNPVTVLSDQNYRTGMVLKFYRRVLPPDCEMIVYDGTKQPLAAFEHGPPRWFIIHSPVQHSPPVQAIEVPGISGVYRFDREFTYYGLSGYCWYVYRRTD